MHSLPKIEYIEIINYYNYCWIKIAKIWKENNYTLNNKKKTKANIKKLNILGNVIRLFECNAIHSANRPGHQIFRDCTV